MRWVVGKFSWIPALTTHETPPFVVGVELRIRGPHIYADECGGIVPFSHIRRPVQESSTEPKACVASADYDTPDVQRGLMPSMCWPDGLLVQVQRLFGIDSNGRGRDAPVPGDPRLAFE